jgi:hypothetical protein
MATSANAPRQRGGVKHRRTLTCDLYLPGHLVHWIQRKKESESGEKRSWGRFGGIDDDGVIVVTFLDRAERYRTHRPEEIRRVAQIGDKVSVSPRWFLLSVHRDWEHLITVCVADAEEPWRSCSVDPREPASFRDLADRAHDRGGFSISGPVIASWLEDEGDRR